MCALSGHIFKRERPQPLWDAKKSDAGLILRTPIKKGKRSSDAQKKNRRNRQKRSSPQKNTVEKIVNQNDLHPGGADA